MHLLRVSIALLVLGSMAQAGDRTRWENLRGLSTGERIEVSRRTHDGVKGTFVSVTDQSLQLRDGQQEITVPRSEVSKIRRSKGGHKWMWIGLALGAGAGTGIGAGAGENLADESGGDFAGLKPAITGIGAGIGALTGLAIGHWIDSRHRTIYDIR